MFTETSPSAGMFFYLCSRQHISAFSEADGGWKKRRVFSRNLRGRVATRWSQMSHLVTIANVTHGHANYGSAASFELNFDLDVAHSVFAVSVVVVGHVVRRIYA